MIQERRPKSDALSTFRRNPGDLSQSLKCVKWSLHSNAEGGSNPSFARHQTYAGLKTYMSTNDLYIFYRIQTFTHTYMLTSLHDRRCDPSSLGLMILRIPKGQGQGRSTWPFLSRTVGTEFKDLTWEFVRWAGDHGEGKEKSMCSWWERV